MGPFSVFGTLKADKRSVFMSRLSRNLGTSTSWNPQGLSWPLQGLLYFFT